MAPVVVQGGLQSDPSGKYYECVRPELLGLVRRSDSLTKGYPTCRNFDPRGDLCSTPGIPKYKDRL